MLDPSGEYYVYIDGYTPGGIPPSAVLIIKVAKGQLFHSTLDNIPIDGVFNDTTGKIDFTYAVSPIPGLTKHYRGFAIWDDTNQVGYMAGTLTQYEIVVSDGTPHVQFAEHGWHATKKLRATNK
jgi:hypothetical protein